MPELPARPSREYLRKAAKRLARERALSLAGAQREIAMHYGERTWAALLRRVDAARGERPPSLIAAVRDGDVDAVRALLDGGANPRHYARGRAALHVAARYGPLAMVELLIARGALGFQPDDKGRTALDVARLGRSRERDAIVHLLDRPVIDDPAYRAAVDAIHAGDAAALARLLDAQPRLVRERIVEPECYRLATRPDYFRDPKLVWFVANNPRLAERVSANVVAITRVLIDRGAEPADVAYTLELTMTSASARESGQQIALIRTLVDAGARPTPAALLMTAAHRELDAVRAALDGGVPLDAPLAAALGDLDALDALLPGASPADVQAAFGLAVINHQVEAVRRTLQAGPDVDAYLPVHAHSTALHQAVGHDDPVLIELLLAHGAAIDRRDTLWDGTPLGWALHGDRRAAQAVLERAGATTDLEWKQPG